MTPAAQTHHICLLHVKTCIGSFSDSVVWVKRWLTESFPETLRPRLLTTSSDPDSVLQKEARPCPSSALRCFRCFNRLSLSFSPLLQIHAHYELKKSSRHRRNLAITGGVALSIITAPVIAAVSVGKKLVRTAIRHALWISEADSRTEPSTVCRSASRHAALLNTKWRIQSDLCFWGTATTTQTHFRRRFESLHILEVYRQNISTHFLPPAPLNRCKTASVSLVPQVSVCPSCWPTCTAWCPSLCVEVAAVAWAEGRAEVCGSTLMRTTVQSQVRTPNAFKSRTLTFDIKMFLWLYSALSTYLAFSLNSYYFKSIRAKRNVDNKKWQRWWFKRSLCVCTVADAWRALKSPSLGESSLDGAVSGLSTTSPSEGLSVAPGTLGDTPHFNTLAGGALGTRNAKYSRWGEEMKLHSHTSLNDI